MLRWIYRDANGLCTVQSLTKELSYFADMCIAVARDFSHASLIKTYGEPIGEESGQAQSLCVIAMGKLGAYELNLSSDIDLIFSYPEAGETQGPSVLSNQEFFIRLGQKIIKLLDAITDEGFVFRVDMRLRPWGDGSVLASSFSAMEAYYERHGREWERYAFIKARVCVGDAKEGKYLMDSLRPFVFRRYIDFGVFESLRDMKAMIEREVRRKGIENDIKLGRGGIREVEFIAQAFQLIHGGMDKRLQQREILTILPILQAEGMLPEQMGDKLTEAYLFLRYVEHRIQALNDQQTQSLPTLSLDQQRLSASLGFESWEAFIQRLEGYRELVGRQFRNVVVAGEEAKEEAASAGMAYLWSAEESEVPELLQAQGFIVPETVQLFLGLRNDRVVLAMQRVGRERLDKLMPLLLLQCSATESPDIAFERCLPLLESVLRRSAYMMLLVENPAALERLVNLCAASPWIAEELARYPVLLDELINAHTLFAPPQKQEISAELRQMLMRTPEDDLEAQMDTLRIFQKGQVLRVAASDITGTLPLMKVSDYLTWLAEAVLEEVVWLSWRQLVARYGTPTDTLGQPCNPGFVIVGYGKLGGIELGYGSDLDLVFIHNGDMAGETDGERPLDNASFYVRLGQKIIAFLTTLTATGKLYDVDMRLRPSGHSGMLVSSLAAFHTYQVEQAWTWEHQALVRARVVAGDAGLLAAFDQERHLILAKPREGEKLRKEVIEMRDKMRAHLSSEAPGHKTAGFEIKHDRGGIVDIEFMVQYAVLAWAHEYPELTRYPDNVRILEGLANLGLLPTDVANGLRDAYLQYRARGHRLALANQDARVSEGEFQAERALVQHWWNILLGVTS
jgi:glutamate-ammonia-ligase adenylyltransferase